MPEPVQTILLIEPNLDLREAAEELLLALGYGVLSCSDRREAMRRLRDTPTVDLLLADAYVEEGGSLDLVDRLRRRIPGLPAVLLSGFGDDPELRRRVLAGGVGFLPMPFSADDLSRELERALTPGAQNTEPPPGRSDRVHRSRRLPAWGLAAAALLLVSGVALRTAVVGPPPLPAPPTDEVERGAALRASYPLGAIRIAPRQLSWEPLPAATTYVVRLIAVDDTLLWQGEVAEAAAPLPDSVIDSLQPAVTYLWSVEALDGDRAPIAQLEPSRFQIRPGVGPAPSS